MSNAVYPVGIVYSGPKTTPLERGRGEQYMPLVFSVLQEPLHRSLWTSFGRSGNPEFYSRD